MVVAPPIVVLASVKLPAALLRNCKVPPFNAKADEAIAPRLLKVKVPPLRVVAPLKLFAWETVTDPLLSEKDAVPVKALVVFSVTTLLALLTVRVFWLIA